MRVSDYEYNENAEAMVSQERGEELIKAVEIKIRKNSIPHFEILKIGKNDEEFEFIYNYLEEKGITIRGTNITMEDIEGYKEVAKAGVNYYNLPEVIEPEIERGLFEKLYKIKEEKISQGLDYLKDDEYKDIRRQIAEGNLRLAKYITTFKSFRKVNIEPDDLLAFGYRGLNDAIDKFDDTKGCKFSTYAWTAIYRRIERGIANEYGINQNQYLEYKELQDVRQLFFEETGKQPTAEDLSNILGFSVKKINGILKFDEMVVNYDSLEERVYDEDVEEVIDKHHDSGKVETFYNGDEYEYYEDGVAIEADHEDDVIDFENDVQEKAQLVFMKKKINEVLETLTPREAEVLRLRFGMRDGSPKTLEEVGKEFNVQEKD